jgi:CCR4-NOT complex subunit CAF16
VPVLYGLDLAIEVGTRTLLIGANGVGKSTLLRLVAGRNLLSREALEVFGRSPFHDLTLAHELALVDSDFPVHVDLSVSELLANRLLKVDPRRERELIEVLEIDLAWRMPRLSEGQRRRVQLLLSLRRPIRLLLLDEVTSQLDVVVRSDFLSWLKRESEAAGLTILYATHILDGLSDSPHSTWPTHVLFLGHEGAARYQPISELAELGNRSLLSVCEAWIRSERALVRSPGIGQE